ncbi:conserved exported hypothetical protein [Mesorhizobium metallidurans STM 2683]|uniref:Uncharacterized protein n=1 Tax=Mesorhizobium metallidurans STM 2683 TaxID=1297569 RepID=M5F1H3_9HYPH|nr:hypothetical protein [Mesorhizobium metallidurans]CCV05661.1 conserved exported hypothetical protein [Mesorhizobium metallidurans STM 2683]
MAKIVLEKMARQGGWGTHGLTILVAALLLTAIAWGAAEVYGELAKTPSTEQGVPSASSSSASSDDSEKSKTDVMNNPPVDQNPKADKNPTPQSSTGGDQQGSQPVPQ